jgi:hypothetical protein
MARHPNCTRATSKCLRLPLVNPGLCLMYIPKNKLAERLHWCPSQIRTRTEWKLPATWQRRCVLELLRAVWGRDHTSPIWYIKPRSTLVCTPSICPTHNLLLPESPSHHSTKIVSVIVSVISSEFTMLRYVRHLLSLFLVFHVRSIWRLFYPYQSQLSLQSVGYKVPVSSRLLAAHQYIFTVTKKVMTKWSLVITSDCTTKFWKTETSNAFVQ